MAKKSLTEQITELMKTPKQIRNISIAAHIDHGKTTLSDNLVAGAGMLSEDIAGKALWTDFDDQEQERGITIYSANVSMVHTYKEDTHLINLIDTPGHVDFGGDVTRAMRAVDGTVILACAVEGVMPQTETVIRQALKERVKPVLFINKTDRLIKELKLTPEQMQERFMKIIKNVNVLIQKYCEEEFAEKWLVKVDDGSVAFGSAYKNWAISVPFMKSEGITFKDIIDYCSEDKDKELAKKAPLHQIVLDMVTKHLPDPLVAQEYRIGGIWKGEVDSEIGQAMKKCDPENKLSMVVTKVVPDPHAGLVSTCRIFSGRITKGEFVHLVNSKKDQRVQQVSVYKGPQRIQMDSIPAGNIVGIVGLTEASSGETVTSQGYEMKPFEAIKHMFEPVVVKSIEPSDPKNLTKLITFLKQKNKEDPTLAISINEETGEYLVSGLGELHIEAKIERPLKDKGIDVKTSSPIVVYRESVKKETDEAVEGKSPNKHNRFYITVEPLEPDLYQAIVDNKIESGRVKKPKEMAQTLQEYGLTKEESKKCLDIYNRNLFIDATKGIQYLNETFELILDAFETICNEGPLAKEPLSGVKVKLVDAKLHEDAIHRGPSQVYPAIREALKIAIVNSEPSFLEPVQLIRIDAPEEMMGGVMTEIQNRRGQVMNVENELGTARISAKLPVSEMFGFEAQLKSATGGKGYYSVIDVKYEHLPKALYEKVLEQIRTRKGLDKQAEMV